MPPCIFLLMPNATLQARLKAEVERTLEAVACMPWFGVGCVRDAAPPSGHHP
jgi:hypothetical protein